MHSLKLADFLFTRIQETIIYKQYVKEVNIEYTQDESYGNKYIKVSYLITANELFEELPYNDKESIFKGSPHYIFSLSTYAESYKSVTERELLRLIEFRHIYESLAAYTVLQLEKGLNPDTSIKVKGIDLWPEANYAEKYLRIALQERHQDTMTIYNSDIWQWKRLHNLAKQSRKIYTKDKEYFSITDIQIHNLSGVDIDDIRFVLLHHEVPIRVKGIKTIDEILIHTAKFAEALKKELKGEYFIYNKKYRYKYLISYLYDNYLPAIKNKIINCQQSEFLKQFIIQKGDILQLNDKRIVIANSVSISQNNTINIKYAIIKNNLQISERTRTIGISQVEYLLKEGYFLEYINHVPVKRLSLFSKWMLKRKEKVNFKSFEPDLTRERI